MEEQERYCLESLFGLTGRGIIVTGGSRGIGRELCNALSDLGARVGIIGSNEAACEKAVSELKERGGYAEYSAADVSNSVSAASAVDSLAKTLGNLWGLINCAGANHVEPIESITEEDFQRVLQVNLMGTMHCCRAAGRWMLPAGGGRIVNVTSLCAVRGRAGYTAYSSAKAAIDGFTRSLAAEWAASGVNVNALSPGLVLTDMNRERFSNPEFYRSRVAAIPRGCAGEPAWMVPPVLLMLSPRNPHMTGQILRCDGGSSACEVLSY